MTVKFKPFYVAIGSSTTEADIDKVFKLAVENGAVWDEGVADMHCNLAKFTFWGVEDFGFFGIPHGGGTFFDDDADGFGEDAILLTIDQVEDHIKGVCVEDNTSEKETMPVATPLNQVAASIHHLCGLIGGNPDRFSITKSSLKKASDTEGGFIVVDTFNKLSIETNDKYSFLDIGDVRIRDESTETEDAKKELNSVITAAYKDLLYEEDLTLLKKHGYFLG